MTHVSPRKSEMSETEILEWMRDHVLTIEHLTLDNWRLTYYAFGEVCSVCGESIKDCVKLAANFDYEVAL